MNEEGLGLGVTDSNDMYDPAQYMNSQRLSVQNEGAAVEGQFLANLFGQSLKYNTQYLPPQM